MPPGGSTAGRWEKWAGCELVAGPWLTARGGLDGVGRLGNQPLQDAGVFPASGDQVTVVMQEGNVGHVTAVTAVLVARSLEERKEKKKRNSSNTREKKS